jgi:acyl carrier protein/LPS sulfotransferase NodH
MNVTADSEVQTCEAPNRQSGLHQSDRALSHKESTYKLSWLVKYMHPMSELSRSNGITMHAFHFWIIDRLPRSSISHMIYAVSALSVDKVIRQVCLHSKSTMAASTLSPAQVYPDRCTTNLALSTLPRVYNAEKPGTDYSVRDESSLDEHIRNHSLLSHKSPNLIGCKHSSYTGGAESIPKIQLTVSSKRISHSVMPCRCRQVEVNGFGAIGNIVHILMKLNGHRTTCLTNRSGRFSGHMDSGFHGISSTSLRSKDCRFQTSNDIPRARNQLVRSVFVAGVLHDQMIANQTAYTMRCVAATKMRSLISLSQLVASRSASAHYFSSISTLLGTPGQVNYVAANAFVDVHCDCAYHQGRSEFSIQWGAWIGLAGMMRCNRKQYERLHRLGIGAIDTKTGMYILLEMIRDNMQSPTIVANTFSQNQFNISILLDHTNRIQAHSAQIHVNSTSVDVLEIEHTISEQIKIILGNSIAVNTPFIDAGFDSACLIELSHSMEKCFDTHLPATVTFDHPTIAGLAKFIHDHISCVQVSPCSVAESDYSSAMNGPVEVDYSSAMNGPVEVRSLALRCGSGSYRQCSSADEFWAMLVQGIDAVQKVPFDRWDVDTVSSVGTQQRVRDHLHAKYSRHGTFIRDLDIFDPEFFGLYESEQSALEPQQRELLKVSKEVSPTSVERKHSIDCKNAIDIFVGLCTNDGDVTGREVAAQLVLQDATMANHVKLENLIHTLSESTYAFASNRISHILGFQGSSISVDCASASGLVCVHLAMNSCKLQNVANDFSKASIAASVNLITHRLLSDLHIARHMFPVDGRCKTFDVRADGFERGEGVIAMRLHALNVFCVNTRLGLLMGSSCIHKGGGASLRALRGPAIEYKVRCALSNSKLLPMDISYVETSGLGEPLGDAIEVGAYQRVFCFHDENRDSCIGFGSVHTNISHLDGASGMISVVKAIVMSHSCSTPPILHFTKLNPLLLGHIADIDQKAKEMGHTWRHVNLDKRSHFSMVNGPSWGGMNGVSSFGYGGSMAHVVTNSCTSSCTLQERETRVGKVHFRLSVNTYQRDSSGDMVNKIFFMMKKSMCLRLYRDINATRRAPDHQIETSFHEILMFSASSVCDTFKSRNDETSTTHSVYQKPTDVESACNFVMRIGYAARTNLPSMNESVHQWLDSQVKMYTLLTESAYPSQMSANISKHNKLKRKIVLILSAPRSGSTLLQMMLNTHPMIFAPQELYLLNFVSMQQREHVLSNSHKWALEGLRKAIIELCKCHIDTADAILHDMKNMSIKHVYELLQTWCDSQILVDKSPPYLWSLATLQRAEAMFEDVRYIFLHRHPCATINSMVNETTRSIQRGTCDLSSFPYSSSIDMSNLCSYDEKYVWEYMDKLWSEGHSNVNKFFQNVHESRRLNVSYEALVSQPSTVSKRICKFLNLPYCELMSNPYFKENTSMFQPVELGGLSAGDPHILKHASINPQLANAWNHVNCRCDLSDSTQKNAMQLQYRIPRWKMLASAQHGEMIKRLNSYTSAPLVIFVHDIDGELNNTFRSILPRIHSAAFSLDMSICYNVHSAVDLADACLHYLVEELDVTSSDDIVLVASGLGAIVTRELIKGSVTGRNDSSTNSWMTNSCETKHNLTISHLLLLFDTAFTLLAPSRPNKWDECSLEKYCMLQMERDKCALSEVNHVLPSVPPSSPNVRLEHDDNFNNHVPVSVSKKKCEEVLLGTDSFIQLVLMSLRSVTDLPKSLDTPKLYIISESKSHSIEPFLQYLGYDLQCVAPTDSEYEDGTHETKFEHISHVLQRLQH